MTENRRIFWNVIATYGRSLYVLVLGLFCGRWALMALGEVDYGLNGLVGGLMVFVSFFNNILAGANARFYAYNVGAAKVAADKKAAIEECRRWFNTALSVHMVVPFVLVIMGYPLGVYAIKHWLTIPPERVAAAIWVFRCSCASCFIGMLNVPFSAMYKAKQYIAELTIYSFVTATLNVVVLYYMIQHPGDWLVWFAIWMCFLHIVPHIIICIRALCIFPECHIVFHYMWDFSRLRQLGAFSGWQMLGTVCGILRTQGMAIVINKFFGPRMNAAQSLGNVVRGQCTTLASAMQGAFTPVIVQACGAGDAARMRAFALRTCKFNVLLSLIFLLPLALELDEVMRLWLKTPPAYTVGLCYCAIAYYLVDCCTTGHLVVINAIGRIATYQMAMSVISVFTLPVAVTVGLIWRNVYAISSVVVAMQGLNSLGRVVFARHLASMSIYSWVKEVAIPGVLIVAICGLIGAMPRLVMHASLLRVIATTVFCEIVFVPLFWFVLLSDEERKFVRDKFGTRIRGMFMR